MSDVLIIGNSGAARECYWILQDLLSTFSGLASYYHFKGFFSWKGYKNNLKELDSFFLGDIDDYEIQPDDIFVAGVGLPDLRREIFTNMKERGANFMNLIHPWTDICKSAVMGEGNIFQRGSTVYANAVIGNCNYINGAANLSHDAEIGDFNFLGPYSIILGGAKIGSENHFGPHSVALEHCRVGNHNLLAPGSVIYKGCKNNLRLSGNPALPIGKY